MPKPTSHQKQILLRCLHELQGAILCDRTIAPDLMPRINRLVNPVPVVRTRKAWPKKK